MTDEQAYSSVVKKKYRYLPSEVELESNEPPKRFLTLQSFKDNFFIIAGVSVTVYALCSGLRYLLKRDSRNQQKMMRLRIFGQGFAVCALLIATVRNSKNVQKK